MFKGQKFRDVERTLAAYDCGDRAEAMRTAREVNALAHPESPIRFWGIKTGYDPDEVKEMAALVEKKLNENGLSPTEEKAWIDIFRSNDINAKRLPFFNRFSEFLQDGLIDGKPWWEQKDDPGYSAWKEKFHGGLAGYRPEARSFANPETGEEGEAVFYYRPDSREPDFFVYNDGIYGRNSEALGGKRRDCLFRDMGKGGLKADGLLALIWKSFKEKNQKNRDDDNALFAMQQMAIVKWGTIRLEGSEAFVRANIEIAAKNGDWMHIEPVNEQQRIMLHRAVLNHAGFTSIWSELAGEGNPARYNLSIADAEKEIRSALNGVYAMCDTFVNDRRKNSDLDLGKDKAAEIIKIIKAHEKELGDTRPGALMQRIIGSQLTPGHEFLAKVRDIFAHIANGKRGFIEKVRKQVVDRADSRNALAEAVNAGERITRPVTRELAMLLSGKIDPTAVEVRDAAKVAKNEVEAYNAKVPDNEKKLKDTVGDVMAFMQRLGSLGAGQLKSVEGMLASAETVLGDDASMSAKVNAVYSKMREAGLKDYEPDFSSLRRDMETSRDTLYASYKPRARPDLSRIDKDEIKVNNASYQWLKRERPGGDAYFLHNADGSAPLAMLKDGIVYSDSRSQPGFPEYELRAVLEKSLGECVEIQTAPSDQTSPEISRKPAQTDIQTEKNQLDQRERQRQIQASRM